MKEGNINKVARLNVLISPLDWGLGHATRCIPVINCLLEQEVNVIIAASGNTATLLKAEFPSLKVILIQPNKIKYSRKNLVLNLIRQSPSAYFRAKKETAFVDEVIIKEKIDAIISDNRIGFYSKKIPSVYITHQLGFKTSSKVINKILQLVHYSIIDNFSQCWVPDNKAGSGLAGELSHPQKMPGVPVHYIGPLSRFNQQTDTVKKYKFLFLLSGPEPQRTFLEEKLINEFKGVSQIAIVRGLPDADEIILKNLAVFNHLSANELANVINQSEIVIARSGYSSIMDLAALESKCILIPTPGQPEQEYLAEYLHRNQRCETLSQDEITKEKIIALSKQDHQMSFAGSLEKSTIIEWLRKISCTEKK